jgi:hypothetical protein
VSPPPRHTRPAWPLWLAFSLVLLPGALVLGLVGDARGDAADRLAFEQSVAGRSTVETGRLAEIETNPGLPTSTALYDVTLQDAQTGATITLVFGGDSHWGLPPSPDYPQQLDFLVVHDDGRPYAAARGPVGSIAEVTAESVADARKAVSTAGTVLVVSIVVYAVAALALLALAVLRTVRRSRAMHAVQRLPAPRL